MHYLGHVHIHVSAHEGFNWNMRVHIVHRHGTLYLSAK